MVIRQLKKPIQLISLDEIEVDINFVRDSLRQAYENEYEWDLYLFQQNKIDFLKKNLDEKFLDSISEQFWAKYYTGVVTESELVPILAQLSNSNKETFASIKPNRKRLISEFNLKLVGNDWEINRIPARSYGQQDALVNSSNGQDYRLSKRSFKELPESLDDEYLQIQLTHIANCIKEKVSPIPTSLNVIVHHTVVFCFPDVKATNAPEGVHQDGMDYIVSALVVERKNVKGGKSIIYGRDAKTELVNVTLQPGQGILQPDKDSDLWHTVTPIECRDNKTIGYRSTIGFDVSVH